MTCMGEGSTAGQCLFCIGIIVWDNLLNGAHVDEDRTLLRNQKWKKPEFTKIKCQKRQAQLHDFRPLNGCLKNRTFIVVPSNNTRLS